MADIGQALKWCIEGNKVAINMNDDFYICYENCKIFFKYQKNNEYHEDQHFSFVEISDTSWKIYKPKEKTLEEEFYHNVDIVCGTIILKRTSCVKIDAVKRFIENIKKDLKIEVVDKYSSTGKSAINRIIDKYSGDLK